MNYRNDTTNLKELQEINDRWQKEIASRLPKDLREVLKKSGAMKRFRGIKSGTELLKILFLYATSKLSFRMLAFCASVLSISDISDTAWRKQFQKSVPFLQELLDDMLKELGFSSSYEPYKRNVYFVDATTIRQEGKEGQQYRVHLCYHLNTNRMSQIKLTDQHTAESLSHYHMEKEDLFLADAGYGTAKNYAIARDQKADVILRISPNHCNLYTKYGEKIDFLTRLKQAREKRESSFEEFAYICYHNQYYWTRIVVSRLPEDKIGKSKKRKQKKAKKNGNKIKEETLVYAEYVILATSLGIEYDPEEILSLYRSRWQIELLFKRIKQNFKIRNIRKGG